MRRRVSLVAGLCALAGIVAVSIAWFSSLTLQSGTAQEELRQRLQDLTGLPLRSSFASNYELLPRSRLTLSQVSFGREGSALKVDSVVADLDLWAALTGRTSVTRLTLIRPEIGSPRRFAAARALKVDAPASPRLLSDVISPFFERFGDLTRIEIRDGAMRTGSGRPISDIDLVIAWPAPDEPGRIWGSYVWNGQPTEINLRIAAPLALLRGEASAVRIDSTASPLRVSFDGTAAFAEPFRIDGRLSLQTPSFNRAVNWLGSRGGTLPNMGPMGIDSEVSAIGARVTLRDAAVTLARSSGRGALEFDLSRDGRPTIGGTLAFGTLDVDDLRRAVLPLPSNPLDLQRPLSFAFVDDLDLDVRLSAGTARIGRLPLSDLAATVKFKDGVATVDVGDCSLLGGRAQARLQIDTMKQPRTVKGSAALNGIDMSGLIDVAQTGSFSIAGQSDVGIDLMAPASDWLSFIRENRLDVTVSTGNGSLGGFDTDSLTNLPAPLKGLAASGDGIAFTRFESHLTTSGTSVRIPNLRLEGPAGRLEATGTVEADSGRIDLSGNFLPADAAKSQADAAIGFAMSGDWPGPTVRLDAAGARDASSSF